jgi:hypothetical protein
VAKLPPFQIAPRAPLAAAAPAAAANVEATDVGLLTLYSRVYCSVIDRQSRRLLLYRLYS